VSVKSDINCQVFISIYHEYRKNNILIFRITKKKMGGGYSDMLELLMKILKDTMRSEIVDHSIDYAPRLGRRSGHWPRLVPFLLSSQKQWEILTVYWASRLAITKIYLYKYGLLTGYYYVYKIWRENLQGRTHAAGLEGLKEISQQSQEM